MNRRFTSIVIAAGFAILTLSLITNAQPVTNNGGLSRVNVHGSGGLTGSGWTTNPLTIRQDCSSGSGLVWSGTSWGCGAVGGSSPSVISPTAITGTTNDWAPSGYTSATTAIRVDTSGTVTLNGLSGGSTGRIIYLEFIGANNVTIVNQSGVGTVANNFITGTGTNLTFTQSQNVGLIYDSTTSRWRLFAYPDNVGTGDITGITAGNGLTGDATSGTASLAVGAGTNITVNANDVQLSTNVAVGGTLSVSAGATTLSDLRYTIISPTAITGATNDWAPTSLSTATEIRINTAGSVTLSGITGGAAGRHLRLKNVGADAITVVHDATSTAANRFSLVGGDNWILQAGHLEALDFVYSSATSRWEMVGTKTFPRIYVVGTANLTGNTTIASIQGNEILPTGLTGTMNDWAPTNLSTARIIQATASATATITGLTGGTAGRMLTLCNVGTNTIQLANENASSTAANRFRLPAASTVIIPGTSYWASNGYECIELVYDSTLSRWAVMADGRSTRAQFETTVQLYSAGTTNMIGTASAAGDVNVGDAYTDILAVTSHTQYKGTVPVLTGCTAACSIASYSTDHRGIITCSDTNGTTCTVTFNQAWATNPPACTMTGTDTSTPYVLKFAAAPTTTAFTFIPAQGAQTIHYHCDGML